MDRGPEQTFFQRHIDGQQAHEKMLNITNCQANSTQNHKDIYHLTLVNWLLSKKKKQKQISVGEDVVKREHSCTVGGKESWYSHYGKQYRGSSKH